MDVTINEHPLSLWTEYDISTQGRVLHAKKEMFTLFAKVALQTEEGEIIARLQGQFSILQNKYEFDLVDGGIYHFQCVDRWKSIYECRNGDEVFTLYEHKGLNRSIFKNDQQIAAYTKNRISFGSGNKYEIQMDADANLVLIVCMVLALSVAEDNDDQQTVNIDIGNVGPQGRELDLSWIPK